MYKGGGELPGGNKILMVIKKGHGSTLLGPAGGIHEEVARGKAGGKIGRHCKTFTLRKKSISEIMIGRSDMGGEKKNSPFA